MKDPRTIIVHNRMAYCDTDMRYLIRLGTRGDLDDADMVLGQYGGESGRELHGVSVLWGVQFGEV